MINNIKMIPCIKCKKPMPELRKIQYKYDFCVECSTVGIKKAIPIQRGTGDNTWDEIIIVDEEHYNSYIKEREQSIKPLK